LRAEAESQAATGAVAESGTASGGTAK
jgi:hypothetical protein